jgi:dihydrofolate reductase
LIGIIAAMDSNNLIGNNGALPWNLPEDLKFFKRHTKNNAVLMGRKTFESIGKALPDRLNIVLTRDYTYKAKGCIVLHSIDEIKRFYRINRHDFGIMYVIGGSLLFNEFIPLADFMILTEIDHEFVGDVYFPRMNWRMWDIKHTQKGVIDENNPYNYYFVTYERRK